MIEGQDGPVPSSVTEGLVLGQLIFGFICFAAAILQIYFEKKLASYLFFIGCLIAVSLLIFGGVWLCKLLVDFVNRKLKVEDLTKYRNDYLIAFGSIGTCAVFIEVMVFFVECTFKFNIFTAQVYIITTASIYYFFLFPSFDRTCTWNYMDGPTGGRYFLTSVFSHCAVLLVSCRIAVEYNEFEMKMIVLYQLGCSIVTAITFYEFARVWWVGVRLINVDEGRNEVVVQPVESRRSVDESSAKAEPESVSLAAAPKPSCNICSVPYTETGTHTPRLIKECGHTICEQCVGKLLNAKHENLLICPFCQKPTIVNGPAGTLPKNFALLEYRTEVIERTLDTKKTV